MIESASLYTLNIIIMSSKLNIFEKEWLDVVFESRNKEYGAYELRKMSSTATNKAMVTVFFVVLLSVVGKFAYDQRPKEAFQSTIVDLTPVTPENLIEKEEIEEIIEPLPVEKQAPQQIAQDPPAMELVRFPDVDIVDRNKVTEELVTQDDLKGDKTPARITLKSVKGGAYVAQGEFGPTKKLGEITGTANGDINGTKGDEIFSSVEIMPQPVGGMPAFIQWVSRNYQYPQSAIDNGVKGVVQVSFVVEKDGTLTDIQVKSDIGYGSGEEAVKLLKKAKKWKHGIQNGVPVRVSYTMPIRLSTI
ncbi:energy transducer TonB [Sphingobacterium hungaricum]